MRITNQLDRAYRSGRLNSPEAMDRAAWLSEKTVDEVNAWAELQQQRRIRISKWLLPLLGAGALMIPGIMNAARSAKASV